MDYFLLRDHLWPYTELNDPHYTDHIRTTSNMLKALLFASFICAAICEIAAQIVSLWHCNTCFLIKSRLGIAKRQTRRTTIRLLQRADFLISLSSEFDQKHLPALKPIEPFKDTVLQLDFMLFFAKLIKFYLWSAVFYLNLYQKVSSMINLKHAPFFPHDYTESWLLRHVLSFVITSLPISYSDKY